MPQRMDYLEVAPPSELLPCVKFLWQMRSSLSLPTASPSRVLPDGCVDLVIHVGDPPVEEDSARTANATRSYVVGPLLRSVDVRLAGRVHVAGVCLRPGGVSSLLGMPASALANQVVALREVSDALAAQLENELRSEAPGQVLTRLAGELVRRYRGRLALDRIAAEAVRLIQLSKGAVSVAGLATTLGTSVRQLERSFDRHVGLSPKVFSRVARFDQVVRRLRSGRDGVPWCALADEYGYYDQAHFVHEFSAFGNMTPTAFEAEQVTRVSHSYNTETSSQDTLATPNDLA